MFAAGTPGPGQTQRCPCHCSFCLGFSSLEAWGLYWVGWKSGGGWAWALDAGVPGHLNHANSQGSSPLSVPLPLSLRSSGRSSSPQVLVNPVVPTWSPWRLKSTQVQCRTCHLMLQQQVFSLWLSPTFFLVGSHVEALVSLRPVPAPW